MEPKPKFMYLIPNFQNSNRNDNVIGSQKRILKLAKDNGVLILEDNPYGDLRFEGEAIPSIKSLDEDGLVLCSKSF